MNFALRVDPAGRFLVTLRTCLCFLALFAIVIALQISGGFVNLRGPIWLVLAVLVCAAALACPRLALELPSRIEFLFVELFYACCSRISPSTFWFFDSITTI
jgi:hypothetical protein